MQAFRKFLYSLTLILFGQQIHAQGACEQWIGKLASAQGQVEIRRAGSSSWQPVMNGERYCDMDAIRTGRNSRAVVILNTDPSNRTLTNLNQNTFLTFKSLVGGEPNALELLIDLLKGGALFRSRQPNRLSIETPYVNAAHRGTEFLVKVDADQTLVTVYDGQVATSNTTGKLTIDKGETALAKRGKAPVKYALVRPRDAVQWALHYPPVIDYQAVSSTPSHPAIGDALSAYRRGDVLEALAILEKVPEAQREPDYYTTKGGLLLSVGRVDEATPAIEKALTLDSKNATAFALKSVIAVAQNRNDEAMQLAERAAQLDPKSPTPQVALSYAHQAKFELEKALESAEKAAELGPGNALALSRLSELQLSMGDLDEALEAAEKATALDPDLARTQTVLGFAYLTKIDIDEARQTFEKAIELDQSAPLPHLGLGLANIREGELKNGTDEIEIAASLDPDNSLIRSYLGKAFYEKKENLLAGTELEIAKELDPNDPTPWFYDAIRKQTTNRPVEALHDMQKAIELNDNRAVYRSRLLLDEDLAGRAVSLARIFDNLRFDQLAVNESSKSLTLDPSNYSAHRFLADTYANKRRNKVAQASEIFQAQLMQPLNINPVQPVLAETDLNILIGTNPSDVGFNEFTPIFEHDSVHFLGAGVIGNRGTHSDQAVLTGLYDKLSFSLGQLHYETDGFRKNNELRHNLYNVFTQLTLTDQLSVQFEYRRRESDEGDLKLNFEPFDPDFFSETFDRDIKQNTARFGLSYSPGLRSDLTMSLLYSERKEQEVNDEGGIVTDIDNRDGYDFQTQYVYAGNSFNITSGYATYNFNGNLKTTFVDNDPSIGLRFRSKEDLSGKVHSGYLYSNISLPRNLLWTAGLSVVSFKDGQNKLVKVNRVLPKIGLQWQISNHIRLRLAAMQTVKRSLIFEQTQEPTQIAGFSQFFDDFNGTIAKRYGIGLDIKFNQNLSGGIELSRRDLDVPRIFDQAVLINPPQPEGKFNSNFKFEDQREDLYRTYFYWTSDNHWSISAEYKLERFRRRPAQLLLPENGFLLTAEENLPKSVRTTTLPISLNYFSSAGPFASIGATYVRQKVQDAPSLEFPKNPDDFVVVDASIGFRLPKRIGIISLQLKNLFDKEFRYFDTNLQTNDPNEPVFLPDRSIFGRILFNF